MMTEISLNILDVVQNSIKAEASLIQILVSVNQEEDCLRVVIEDNGRGMTKEQVQMVEDPFFTTRTTRKVGLGIPFFKLAAESTGGYLTVRSEPGKGTKVEASFILSHIDRMPLGDINGTVQMLIRFNTQLDFLYEYRFNEKGFTLDTREMRAVLGDVPLDSPEVSSYISEYLQENQLETDGGIPI